MSLESVEIYGSSIVDKWTHFEAYPYVGPERATVTIRGDIASAFYEMYGVYINDAIFTADVDFGRNDEKIDVCLDSFKPGSHLSGSIATIDDIKYEGKRVPREFYL